MTWMVSLATFGLLTVSNVVFGAVLPGPKDQITYEASTPVAIRNPSPNIVTANTLAIKKTNITSRSSKNLDALRYGYRNTSVYSVLDGEEYAVTIELAGRPYEVLVDTGSSVTWVIQEGFQCLSANGTSQPETTCQFGPAFAGTFQEGQIENENFNITYLDGEFLNGVLGYEDVTIAGITASHAELSLVNYAYWNGDGISSGLLGLAYDSLSHTYNGSDPSADSESNLVEYESIITTMIKQRAIPPVFSMALERNSNGGSLALGGLPPVPFTPVFGSTPIRMINVLNTSAVENRYLLYTIIADAYIYEGADKFNGSLGEWSDLFPTVNKTQFPVVVDSGSTLLHLPTEMAHQIASLYDPPAVYIEGTAFAPCNATSPKFGVQIGGVVFYISPADMLMQNHVDSTTGYCLTGLQDGGQGPYILGDTFLNNVVAVFDVGASEMRFAASLYK